MTSKLWSTSPQLTPLPGLYYACAKVLHPSITSPKILYYQESSSWPCFFICFYDIAIRMVIFPHFRSPSVMESWLLKESFSVKSDPLTWGWKCRGVKMWSWEFAWVNNSQKWFYRNPSGINMNHYFYYLLLEMLFKYVQILLHFGF